MKNPDKYIVLGDLSTLFLAALVFHVWKLKLMRHDMLINIVTR